MISIGYVVGTSVAGLVVLFCLLVVAGGVYLKKTEGEGLGIASGGLFGALAVTALWVLLAFPPFDMDYHRYDTEKGTVESIDKRLVSDGESGMSEKYVVRFEGRSDQLGCLDTRCADVKKGDSLELTCVKVWQWYGTPGHDCEFVSTDKN